MATRREYVPIPDDTGIVVRKAGKKRDLYVYRVKAYTRTANGKPTHRDVCLGRVAEVPGMMYPNGNYDSIYGDRPPAAVPAGRNSGRVNAASGNGDPGGDARCLQYGFTFLVYRLCGDTGLREDLESVFGAQAMDLIAMAAHMIRNGVAMANMEEWQEDTYLPYDAPVITPAVASGIFESLTRDRRMAFFRKWVARHGAEDPACFDVASMTLFSRGTAENGSRRGGREEPRINLGAFCTLNTRIPLFYAMYEGDLSQGRNLEDVLSEAREAGIGQAHLFVDPGFWSADGIRALAGCKSFTVAVPLNGKYAQHAIARAEAGIRDGGNAPENPGLSAVETKAKAYGKEGRLAVCFDQAVYDTQLREFSRRIARWKSELEEQARPPKRGYRKYFRLEPDGKGSSACLIDYDGVKSAARTFGYAVLFTTGEDLTPAQLFEYYRSSDVDERQFEYRQEEFRRETLAPGQDDRTRDGRMFVQFLALIIRSLIYSRLKGYMAEHSLTMAKVVAKLCNIRARVGRRPIRLDSAIPDTQREILSEFDAYPAILDSFC